MRMNEPLTDGWQSNGKHLERFEPPDIFHSRVLGDVDAPHIVETHRRILQWTRELGRPLFWLADLSQVGRILPAARRVDTPTLELCGLAIVGANFQQRVVVTLGITAHRILFRRLLSLPIAFCATETDARAWCECERAKAAPPEARAARANSPRTR
jgi:hypothetical protein